MLSQNKTKEMAFAAAISARIHLAAVKGKSAGTCFSTVPHALETLSGSNSSMKLGLVAVITRVVYICASVSCVSVCEAVFGKAERAEEGATHPFLATITEHTPPFLFP